MINKLNENNVQAPFQYKISDNTFELKTVSGGFLLNTNNGEVKVLSGQRLFCADIGYAVDGPLEEMEFLIDDIKIYPQLLENLKDLQTVEIKDNEIYLIKNELDFKSIIFFPPSDLNKNFKFTITTYSSTFSSFMFDEIAKKLNSLDRNYPIINYYEGVDYKVNDIIKYNSYLYRVFKEFKSDGTDYYLKANCNLLTPFKKLELDTNYKANELIEYENNFFIVQKDFRYEDKNGVLTDLNGLLKPLQDIIIWFDGIAKIYKNQIIIKDNISYIVLEDIENPIWDNIQSKLDYLNKASNTFYDDTNSGFGNNINTVQKAIEKLKISKQENLISGSNININENKISVNGGVNKEYIEGNIYLKNDLIVTDKKIYKVNEDFIASNWNADINKCSLLNSGGGTGSNDAIDISFDNSQTNLKYISGYDFPKYKTPISDTIDIVLNDGTSDYNGSIIKQSDGSYILKCNISNCNIDGNFISIAVKNVNNSENIYRTLSFLSQFFNIQTIYTSLESLDYINFDDNEFVISDLSINLKFALIYNDNDKTLTFIIVKEDLSIIDTGIYNITLNIKNRVLRPEDINIFAYSDPFMSTQKIMDSYILSLVQDNGNVKLKGSYTLKEGAGVIIASYNPIINNYFNFITDISQMKITPGITSKSGKKVKFGIIKTEKYSNEIYLLFVSYEDASPIEVGDTITFDFIPDKNYTLDTVYEDVANVQEAITALYKLIQNSQLIHKWNKGEFEIYNHYNNSVSKSNQIKEQIDAVNIQSQPRKDGLPQVLAYIELKKELTSLSATIVDIRVGVIYNSKRSSGQVYSTLPTNVEHAKIYFELSENILFVYYIGEESDNNTYQRIEYKITYSN